MTVTTNNPQGVVTVAKTIAVLLIALCAVAFAATPIERILSGPRTLQSETAVWVTLLNAAEQAGCETRYMEVSVSDSRAKAVAETLHVNSRPYSSWHVIKVPPACWSAVIVAWTQQAGQPRMSMTGNTAYATWLLEWAPGGSDHKVAITLAAPRNAVQ